MPPVESALPGELLLSPGGRWVAVAGLFALGAILGSFLNVVVHRWPRGLSVVHPPSHCPACGKPVRWHDNVPVVGWLVLKGRCRDCGAAISPRYPIVESLCGAISGLVAWSQCVPQAADQVAAGQGEVFAFQAGGYALAMLVIGPLVAAAVLEYDGQRVSWRLPAVALVLVLATRWFWGEVGLDVAAGGIAGRGRDVVWGLLAALVLAAVAWPAWLRTGPHAEPAAGVSATLLVLLVGAGLGVRGVSLIAAAAMVCHGVTTCLGQITGAPVRLGWATWLAAATLVDMLLENRILRTWPWLADQSELAVWLMSGAVVAISSAIVALTGTRLHRAAL